MLQAAIKRNGWGYWAQLVGARSVFEKSVLIQHSP